MNKMTNVLQIFNEAWLETLKNFEVYDYVQIYNQPDVRDALVMMAQLSEKPFKVKKEDFYSIFLKVIKVSKRTLQSITHDYFIMEEFLKEEEFSGHLNSRWIVAEEKLNKIVYSYNQRVCEEMVRQGYTNNYDVKKYHFLLDLAWQKALSGQGLDEKKYYNSQVREFFIDILQKDEECFSKKEIYSICTKHFNISPKTARERFKKWAKDQLFIEGKYSFKVGAILSGILYDYSTFFNFYHNNYELALLENNYLPALLEEIYDTRIATEKLKQAIEEV